MRRATRRETSSKTGSRARLPRWWMRSIIRQAHKQIAHGSTRERLALCTDCHAKEICRAPVTRATGPTATPPTVAPCTTRAPDEHKPRAPAAPLLPQLQTIQWVPGGLDRRCATIRLQALDRAMQAAKANTAAPIQRLWSKMALRVAPGRKPQEVGMMAAASGMKFRKRLALAEKGDRR